MYFTHKFMDEEAHEATIKANTIDMMEQFVLRNIRESLDNIEVPYDHVALTERVVARITTWVNGHIASADMSDMADFLSLIADEEIKL